MQRKAFDVIASAGGALMVVVLVVAGGLLMWGYSFANSNVHTQLAEQEIVFPPQAAFAHPVAGTEITPSMIPTVSQYAGQELTTGAAGRGLRQRLHRRAPPGDRWRPDLRPAERQGHGTAEGFARLHRRRGQGADRLPGHHPSWPAARSLRLSASSRPIALWAAIASFALAGLMALLVAFGFWHARRTPDTAELAIHAEAVKVLQKA